MDYIKGRLNILKDLEYLKPRGYIYYSAVGTDLNVLEAAETLEQHIGEFTALDIPFHLIFDGLNLCFNTITEASKLTGRYEAILYPTEYGKLSHIYCVGSTEDEGAVEMHIDLLRTWVKDPANPPIVSYGGLNYYLYIQDMRVKDRNVNYNFLFEKGGH
jgi:hypothetical protein